MRNSFLSTIRFFASLIIISIFGLITTSPINAQVGDETDEWVIHNFHSEIKLTNKDKIEVTETIEAEFYVYKHGIVRKIPHTFNNDSPWIGRVKSDVEVSSVTDEDGRAHLYEVYSEGDFWVIKIGDPNETTTGPVTFVINYTAAKDVVRFYNEYDELYWDVTSNQAPVVIKSATAEINIPFNLNEEDLKFACYSGIYGSNSTNCEYIYNKPTLYIESETELSPGEGLSAIIALPKNIIEEPTLWEKYGTALLFNLGLLLPIPVSIVMYFIWRKYGRDPKGRGTIVPEFNPPNEITPAEVGTIYDNTADNKDLSATIIDLAIRGFISIEEGKKKIFQSKEYIFHLKNPNISELEEHEVILINGLFSKLTKGETVKLSSLKNKFYTTVKKLQDKLYEMAILKEYFSNNPKTTKAAFMSVGTAIVVGTMALLSGFLIQFGGLGTMIGLVISGIIIIAFGYFMPKRTEKGAAAYEKILGLKMYIETAEADRIETLQGPDSEYLSKKPDMTVELFEKLLPYAIVMGVESKWSKKFENVYTQPPDWYQGANWRAFNAMHFTNSLMAASNSMNTSMTSSPRSSGSGFSSGGGFSGGGGGGGSVGSW